MFRVRCEKTEREIGRWGDRVKKKTKNLKDHRHHTPHLLPFADIEFFAFEYARPIPLPLVFLCFTCFPFSGFSISQSS